MNLAARSLRLGRSGLLGLALADLSIPYYASFAAEAMRAAERRGYRVVVEQFGGTRGDATERAAGELAALTGQLRALTDGLLFMPLALPAEALAANAGTKPLVLLGEHLTDAPFDRVGMANTEGARAAVAHLLSAEAGARRRVLVLGALPTSSEGTAGLRLAGVRAAHAEAGLAHDDALVVPCAWDRHAGAEAVRRALADGLEFDAVFGLNDVLALGALHGLALAGVRVPEDVAVVGFDNIEESEFAVPGLTTVDPGMAEIADRAVAVVLARAGRALPEDAARLLGDSVLPREGPARHESAYRLVPRGSTGFG